MKVGPGGLRRLLRFPSAHSLLPLVEPFRITPGRLDEGEDGKDLILGEGAAETGHTALRHGEVVSAQHDLDQLVVGMMPGVPRRVLGRRTQTSVIGPALPAGGAPQVRPMTLGARLGVERGALYHTGEVEIGKWW